MLGHSALKFLLSIYRQKPLFSAVLISAIICQYTNDVMKDITISLA